MKLENLATDPKFASSEERDFALVSVNRHEEDVVAKYLTAMQLFWAPLLLMWLFASSRLPEIKSLFFFHIGIAVVSRIFQHLKLGLDVRRRVVFGTVALTQTFWCLTAVYGPSQGDWGRPLTGIWIVMILFSNAFLPVRSYGHNLMFVFAMVTSAIGLEHYFERDLALIFITVCLFLGQNYCIYTHRMVKMAAIARYQEQARYIPKKVLFTAERENIGVLEVFSPAPRYCVCICSDWRNFQKLSKSVSMDELSIGLADYYQQLLQQISQIVPDGNFFFDWIADELFLVIFANDSSIDSKVAREAMVASRRILEFRYEFFTKFGFPTGIDVGVASGVASVGIFSSGAIVKATAFGKIPTEARSLQDTAKHLRKKHASMDRIVMTATFAQEAGIAEGDCTPIQNLSSVLTTKHLSWPPIPDHSEIILREIDPNKPSQTEPQKLIINEVFGDARGEQM